jgi:WD40 repeat protein
MLLSVGSDQSVALWRTPLHKNQHGGDPTHHLIARFRKTGNLGHFLTPTSVAWLHDLNHFAVSYSESVISIYDAQQGKEVSEMVVPCEGKDPILT